MNYASIDIGTNTVLLMIVELTNGMKEICDIAAITRLGEGSKENRCSFTRSNGENTGRFGKLQSYC